MDGAEATPKVPEGSAPKVPEGSAPKAPTRLTKAEKRALKAQGMKERRQQWRERERERHRQAVEQRAAQREEMLAAMTHEERAAFNAKEKEDRDRSYRERCEQTARLDCAFTSGLRVAIDLSYGQKMSSKEQSSLSRQLARCWGVNRRAPAPVSLHLTALGDCPANCLPKDDVHKSWKVHCVDADVTAHFAPEEIVFLSPDADTVLTELDQTKARARSTVRTVVAVVASSAIAARSSHSAPTGRCT